MDASDNPVLAGTTTSSDFPVTTGAYDTTSNGLRDNWIVKLDATGSELLWRTYWGGSGNDIGNGLALDQGGHAVVVGQAGNVGFPTTANAFQIDSAGGTDTFVSMLDMTDATLKWSTLIGGSGNEVGVNVVLDAADRPVVTGSTASADFPTTTGSFQESFQGNTDAFITNFDLALMCPSSVVGPTPPMILRSIHPNPFNPSTVISFSLETRSHVHLDVYDVGGRRVRNLLEATLSGGSHTINWDGCGDGGRMLPSGQYFARLKLDSNVQVRKMVLVR